MRWPLVKIETAQWFDSSRCLDNPRRMKRFGAQVLMWMGLCVLPVYGAITFSKDAYHVYPGDNIQDALQQAAESKTNKVVKVHAGEYQPNNKRQALIWFNRSHDGIRL